MPAPGPSWRGSAESSARQGARSWRRPGSGGVTAWPLRSRWIKTLLSFLSALIAIASIILFIILVFVPGCTQTRFAVLSPAPYSDAGLPPHPYAQQDRDDFRGAFNADNLSERLSANQISNNAKPSKPADARSVLVLYVTALAGRSESGVVIYTVDSGPDEPESYLPLDQLWKYLSSLPQDQKKILAIDLARGPIDWRWGQFARPELAAETDQHKSVSQIATALEKISNLAILTSAAPGEISWVSPSLSRSVFGHFLIRALAGDADGSGTTRRDRRVTLGEIYDYVLTHTNHWVEQNRDLRGQHPQIWTRPEAKTALLETVVTEVGPKAAAAISDAPKPAEGARTKQLEALWEARDNWSAREPEQWHPLAWRQFLEHLRRAEQWWLVGQKEGMDPHLQAAEKAERELAARDANRTPVIEGSKFVAANVARRAGSGTLPESDLVLSERQLQLTLQSFAPGNLPKQIQDANVKLRTRCEQSSWQSYRSRLWIGSLLTEADRDRRLSDDLLFVGSDADLSQASASRQSAELKLQQFDDITGELNDAHRIHNRLLSELPDLAWWAAQRLPVENLQASAVQSRRARLMKEYSLGIDEARFRPPALSEQEKLRDELDDSSLQQTEIDLLLLFEQTRQLARLLDREREADPGFAARGEWREELKVLKQTLTHPERGVDALRNRLIRHAKGLIGSTADERIAGSGSDLGQTQYFHWLRLRNALQWSGLPAETRRGLFADLEQSDRILNANAQKTPVAASAEWNGNDWSSVDGCWQGLWALQSLSLGSSDASMHERWVLWKNAVVDPQKQLDLLMQLGQSTRREFRERVDRALPTPASSDRLDDVMRSMLTAERATRTLHGYDAVLFTSNRDPIRRLQQFDLAALCLSQADRYLDDFWGKVNASDREPWYVQAADQCLRLAGRQNDQLSINSLKTARDEVQRRLLARQSARVKLANYDASVDLSLTAQRSVKVIAEMNDQVPPGTAAIWLSEEGEPSNSLLEFGPAGRSSVTAKTPTAEVVIRKMRTPPRNNCAEIAVRPHLLFRGRYWDDANDIVHVDPCLPSSIDWDYQAPVISGEVAVYGVDRRDTIFILDCSASMSEALVRGTTAGETRFQAARRALSETLRVLRDGPVLRNEKEPHVVGLMAYGHRAKAKEGGKLHDTVTNPNWKPQIPSAVAEDWANDYEILNAPDRLVDDHYRKMMGNLEILQPFGQTPLLGATQMAAGSLIDRKRGGLIVVITDGQYNDEKGIGKRFRELEETLQRHPELTLHIVGFGGLEKEEIATLQRLSDHTRGTYHNAPTGPSLAAAIEKVMKPRQFEVIREAQPRQEFFSNLGEAVPSLAPHQYKVQFPNLAPFSATIYGGERLEFDLDTANKSLKHRRPQPQLLRLIQDSGSASPREPTRFGYLKADFDKGTGRAEFLFCLDRDDILGIIERPAEIRIEIAPRGSRQQFSRSWKLAPGQSIPAWQVVLHDWPAATKPLIQASWKMTRTKPDVQLPMTQLLKGPQPTELPDWPEQSLSITAERQGGKVLVRLQAAPNQTQLNIGDIRVEVGQQSQVESRFIPTSYDWHSRLFAAQRQITYEFDVGENFDVSANFVALTSRNSLDNGSRVLESPLAIDKWDKEQ